MGSALSAAPTSNVNRLVALCVRPNQPALVASALARHLEAFSEWEELLTAAEAHGMGPLVYFHFQASSAAIPPSVLRALRGIYLRHRQANNLRIRALSEILSDFAASGISVIVLKGAALAHLVYPEPGLRPFGDLDLFVGDSQLQEARRILARLGFVAPPVVVHTPNEKHLTMVKNVNGLTIYVELHYRLFPEKYQSSSLLNSSLFSPLPFTVGRQTAYSLGREAMLWHLCQHLVMHASVFLPLRLIWVSDIISIAERFVAVIDWERVRQRYRLVLNVLSLLQSITPLSTALQEVLSMEARRARQEVWGDFHGWPRKSVAKQRREGKSYFRILRDSLFPATWWLRLHYGLSNSSPVYLYRFVYHPWHIVGWVTHLFRERLGLSRAT